MLAAQVALELCGGKSGMALIEVHRDQLERDRRAVLQELKQIQKGE